MKIGTFHHALHGVIFFTLGALFCSSCIAKRIVSTSPQITEWLFQLGLQNEIIATVEGSRFPKEALKIQSIGSLAAPNLEETIRLKPDLILVDKTLYSPLFLRHLKTLGSPIWELNFNRLDNFFSQSESFLQRFYNRALPESFVRVKKCLNNLKPPKTYKYLMLAWADPPIVAGQNAFISDILKKLGGKNLSPNHLETVYSPVTLDWIFRQRPDVVYALGKSVTSAIEPFKNYWGKSIRVIELDLDRYARANLTPLYYLQDLNPHSNWKPDDCR